MDINESEHPRHCPLAPVIAASPPSLPPRPRHCGLAPVIAASEPQS